MLHSVEMETGDASFYFYFLESMIILTLLRPVYENSGVLVNLSNREKQTVFAGNDVRSMYCI